MSKPRVKVDFTSVVEGLVRARVDDSSAPLFIDDEVLAFDPDDDLCADAVVVNMKTPFVFLRVDWVTQRSDSHVVLVVNYEAEYNGTAAFCGSFENKTQPGLTQLPAVRSECA